MTALSGRSSRWLAVLLAFICMSSCGGAQSQAEQVRSAFDDLRSAIAADDAGRVCELISRATGLQIGSVGHEDPTTCRADVGRFLATARRDGRPLPGDPAATRVAVTARRAIATLAMGGGRITQLPFVRENGGWRLASAFGVSAPPAPDMGATRAAIGLLPAPRARTGSWDVAPEVSVRRRGGATCDRVRVRALGADGGCLLTAVADRAVYRLLTPFGDLPFATCRTSFELRLGGDGGVAVESVLISAITRRPTACGDLMQCRVSFHGDRSRWERRPWTGRVAAVRGDALEVDLGLCFDTCAGRFEGPVTLRLVRRGGDWRIAADGLAVGRGGLLVSGAWRVTAPPIRVSAD